MGEDDYTHLEGLAGLEELKASTMPWLVCYATTWLHVVLASFQDLDITKFMQRHKQRMLQQEANFFFLPAKFHGKNAQGHDDNVVQE